MCRSIFDTCARTKQSVTLLCITIDGLLIAILEQYMCLNTLVVVFVSDLVAEICSFSYLYEAWRLLVLICCGGKGVSMIQRSQGTVKLEQPQWAKLLLVSFTLVFVIACL